MKRASEGLAVRPFWRLTDTRKALLAEAALYLLLSRAALVVLPFRSIAARLGMVVRPEALPSEARDRPVPEQGQVAIDVGWAVTHAARWVPFGAVCLPQAMAAKLMLERRGVTCGLHLGVARHMASGREFEAHAWLDAVGVEVTGYPMADGFVEIACFQ